MEATIQKCLLFSQRENFITEQLNKSIKCTLMKTKAVGTVQEINVRKAVYQQEREGCKGNLDAEFRLGIKQETKAKFASVLSSSTTRPRVSHH